MDRPEYPASYPILDLERTDARALYECTTGRPQRIRQIDRRLARDVYTDRTVTRRRGVASRSWVLVREAHRAT